MKKFLINIEDVAAWVEGEGKSFILDLDSGHIFSGEAAEGNAWKLPEPPTNLDVARGSSGECVLQVSFADDPLGAVCLLKGEARDAGLELVLTAGLRGPADEVRRELGLSEREIVLNGARCVFDAAGSSNPSNRNWWERGIIYDFLCRPRLLDWPTYKAAAIGFAWASGEKNYKQIASDFSISADAVARCVRKVFKVARGEETMKHADNSWVPPTSPPRHHARLPNPAEFADTNDFSSLSAFLAEFGRIRPWEDRVRMDWGPNFLFRKFSVLFEEMKRHRRESVRALVPLEFEPRGTWHDRIKRYEEWFAENLRWTPSREGCVNGQELRSWLGAVGIAIDELRTITHLGGAVLTAILSDQAVSLYAQRRLQGVMLSVEGIIGPAVEFDECGVARKFRRGAEWSKTLTHNRQRSVFALGKVVWEELVKHCGRPFLMDEQTRVHLVGELTEGFERSHLTTEGWRDTPEIACHPYN